MPVAVGRRPRPVVVAGDQIDGAPSPGHSWRRSAARGGDPRDQRPAAPAHREPGRRCRSEYGRSGRAGSAALPRCSPSSPARRLPTSSLSQRRLQATMPPSSSIVVRRGTLDDIADRCRRSSVCSASSANCRALNGGGRRRGQLETLQATAVVPKVPRDRDLECASIQAGWCARSATARRSKFFNGLTNSNDDAEIAEHGEV